MDPIANQKEQLELAKRITQINDECDDEGGLTWEQRVEIIHCAGRLAELVLALNEWCKKAVGPLN